MGCTGFRSINRDVSFSLLLLLHLLLPLLLLLLLSSSSVISASSSSILNITTTTHKHVNSLRLSRIQRHLNKINKPPLLSIQSPDGDVIDCVHMKKQPAFDHPALKNHKIQKVAPEMPKGMGKSEKNVSSDSKWGVRQIWHENREDGCPEGTIPIRRSNVDDVLRAKSLYSFGKKQQRRQQVGRGFQVDAATTRQPDAPDVVSGNGHEHAIAYTALSEKVYGAKAIINVWEPSIEVVNEFSLSQIWVLSGSFDQDLNSIEAGWQVSPELYGDSRPRLFTYWTSDAYQATGCYNLLCSGFVQTNNRVAIGAAISPVSSLNSNQYDISILIWKDPKVGNWWMSFGDNTLVGYWPSNIFTHLANCSTMVEWGGEVVNSRANNGQHTSTQMGSGHFADDSFGKASYFRNLELVDSDNSLTSAQALLTLAENPNCYNIKSSSNNEWGTHFYYGGPGKNPLCP